ncbi:MAG TPA: response regulator, partial [Rhodocyclaceae bacterium]
LRKGSVFSVEVPPGARVRSKRQEPRKASPLRISLIEDNADVAKALTYALEAQGHTVLVAVDLTEAIEKLSGSVPDIVISDYRLSGSQNGYDVITAMRAYFEPHLPAMLITGDTDPEIIRHMAQQGVVVHHKPLDMDRFFDALADLTGGENAVVAAPS